MRVAVWRTGHEIADRVAKAFDGYGLLIETPPKTEFQINHFDAHIAYGILRGTTDVFKQAKHWFELDRGYSKPSHYDGYYRISYRGTQQTGSWVAPDYDRLKVLNLDIKPWRGFAPHLPVLVCPPTEHVINFFGLYSFAWGLTPNAVIRKKGDTSPINFSDYNYVLTFNSSVGWQALQAGIPCVSDPTHSMVGSWYNNISLDKLAEAQYIDREKLFAVMAASQFTLAEIEQGKAWDYVKHYVNQAQVEPPSRDA